MSRLAQLHAKYPKGSVGRDTLDFARLVRKVHREKGLKGCLERFYTIRDKRGRVGLIKLNWAQIDFVAEVERQVQERGNVRIVVLKARQLGLSTVIQGIMLIYAVLRSFRLGVTLSHEASSSEYIFSMSKMALEAIGEDGVPLARDAAGHLWFHKPLASKLQVKTARNVETGRSFTGQFLHGSEVAFYPDAGTLMTGLLQTIPDEDSMAFLESTANGVGGFFYDTWMDSQVGDSEWVGKFYPWHHHPEYRAAFTSNAAKEAFRRELSTKEEDLLDKGVSLESLKWRRSAIITRCQRDEKKFQQEYPTTPEEAFLTSGRPTFDPENMGKLLEACRSNQPLRKGYFRESDVEAR